MTECKFHKLSPDKAYVTNNLILPRKHIAEAPVKRALELVYGETDVMDEMGNHLGTRPNILRLWDENEHHLIAPREFIPRGEWPRFKFEFVDLSPKSFPQVHVEDGIRMRDSDQEAALEAMLRCPSGTLNLSCGKGKTVIALKMVAQLKVATIVVVNSTALLEQWREEALKHLGVADVGVVQGDTTQWENRAIVVAMVHTLAGKKELWSREFRRRFGLVIYDEGHHMSAPVFVKSADLFYGRRYSLTATAERLDGLERVYQFHLGPVIHTNLTQQLIPKTIFHRLKWEMPIRDKNLVTDVSGEINLSKVRVYLGSLYWRNHIIYKDLMRDLTEGRMILVLTHSIKHVSTLHDYFSASGSGMITSHVLQGNRMPILRGCNPIFGTFQLAREGLNKPSLDTLYVLTPFSSKNDRQQAWGRIQRQFKGKKAPLVRVYEDTAFTNCTRSCQSLRRNLRNLGYPVEMRTITVEKT
jgi:superfamily II DNA or RNA helicase